MYKFRRFDAQLEGGSIRQVDNLKWIKRVIVDTFLSTRFTCTYNILSVHCKTRQNLTLLEKRNKKTAFVSFLFSMKITHGHGVLCALSITVRRFYFYRSLSLSQILLPQICQDRRSVLIMGRRSRRLGSPNGFPSVLPERNEFLLLASFYLVSSLGKNFRPRIIETHALRKYSIVITIVAQAKRNLWESAFFILLV